MRIRQFVGYVRDAKKQIEEHTRDREERLRSLAEAEGKAQHSAPEME